MCGCWSSLSHTNCPQAGPVDFCDHYASFPNSILHSRNLNIAGFCNYWVIHRENVINFSYYLRSPNSQYPNDDLPWKPDYKPPDYLAPQRVPDNISIPLTGCLKFVDQQPHVPKLDFRTKLQNVSTNFRTLGRSMKHYWRDRNQTKCAYYIINMWGNVDRETSCEAGAEISVNEVVADCWITWPMAGTTTGLAMDLIVVWPVNPCLTLCMLLNSPLNVARNPHVFLE